jgi:transketolase
MLKWDVDVHAARLRDFGWNVVTVDGHDMSAILAAFDAALRNSGAPAAIVARTIKGKGVALFEAGGNWHGKPLKKGEELDKAIADVRSGVDVGSAPAVITARAPARSATPANMGAVAPPSYAPGASVATREAYGTALVKLGLVNPLVTVIDGDTKNSTYAEKFAKDHPERYLEGFIAEQNMIGAAVGLSASGRIPFVSTFAAFQTRAFDQIRMAAISRANLKLAGSHCGVSIGPDGPSQMGLEDIAMMRAVPGSVVLYPCDAVATERLVALMAQTRGIQYIRLNRPKTPVLYAADDQFAIGGSKVLRSTANDAVTVVAAGVTLLEALKAHDRLLGGGIKLRVIDAYSVKPIDAVTIVAAARDTQGRVLVVEDHYFDGGLGDAVLNALAAEPVRVTKLAVTEVPRSGEPEQLLHAHGIDADAIVARVRELLA